MTASNSRESVSRQGTVDADESAGSEVVSNPHRTASAKPSPGTEPVTQNEFRLFKWLGAFATTTMVAGLGFVYQNTGQQITDLRVTMERQHADIVAANHARDAPRRGRHSKRHGFCECRHPCGHECGSCGHPRRHERGAHRHTRPRLARSASALCGSRRCLKCRTRDERREGGLAGLGCIAWGTAPGGADAGEPVGVASCANALVPARFGSRASIRAL